MAKEILVADSDKGDQEEFQKIFETTDYHLVFSESGQEALLRIKLFKPDLIIASAEHLKEMSGVELCGAIKVDPECQHLPFILISGTFGEISEKDRQRVRANGLISKPLNEGEVLNLVDQLMEEGAMEKREEILMGKEKESLLGEIEEEEEEIIELVDVVEEPETRMSIHDFVTTERQEPSAEITPLESWEKLEFPEKVEEKELMLHPEREVIEEMDLQVEEVKPPKESIPEEDLFEKIELEEILEKVEQLKPSLEKEWPFEKEVEAKVLEEEPLMVEEPAEKPLDLSEFEAALQGEVQTEAEGLEIEPFPFEIPKGGAKEEEVPIDESVVEEELKEIPEEEFPDELLEEILGEEEIRAVGEPKEGRAEGIKGEKRIDWLEEAEVPHVLQEEVHPLRTVDKQMQEIITQRVQEMMEEIVAKLVPEMTQNVVGLTIERIEKMVREIVPDLAEKAIQEEIKRLQKGEKD